MDRAVGSYKTYTFPSLSFLMFFLNFAFTCNCFIFICRKHKFLNSDLEMVLLSLRKCGTITSKKYGL